MTTTVLHPNQARTTPRRLLAVLSIVAVLALGAVGGYTIVSGATVAETNVEAPASFETTIDSWAVRSAIEADQGEAAAVPEQDQAEPKLGGGKPKPLFLD